MKVWFEAQMEPTDTTLQCCECMKYMSSPELVFGEFKMVTGSMPNPDELHSHPTGKYMCHKCGKYKLV